MKNKAGLWVLSPSGLYNFIACPACFWVDQHVGRAPSFPLRLNDAMDAKLKSRYDLYRKRREMPPEISNLKGISLYPDKTKLDLYREKKTELQYVNEKHGYVLAGKIDELFVDSKGQIAIADYKSSGDEPKPEKLNYYLLQLHAYALMLKQKGHRVASKGYLLNYYPKRRESPSKSVELACKVIEAKLNLKSFEKTLRKMVLFLNKPYPKANKNCRVCSYHRKRAKKISGAQF